MSEREIRYCTTGDGVRIAYCVDGRGDWAPILVCPGFVESFSVDHLDAGQASFIARLGHGRPLIRFDMRGTGLSQRDGVDLSPDALALDLHAVVKATGIRTCYVWASTLSGPRALQYAADHPRNVLGLMLFGTYARANDVLPADAIRGMAGFVRTSPEFALSAVVGRNTAAGNEAANTEAALRQSEVYMQSANPEMVAEMLIAGAETDVVASLARVRCPVLVLHRAGDTVVPCSAGQNLASRLPQATFVQLAGDAHSFVFGDQEAILAAIEKFTGTGDGLPRSGDKEHERPEVESPAVSSMAVVLFTDIVNSTALTERLGDARFRDISRALDAGLRTAIGDAGGAAIEGKLLGDGVLATFGSAAQAIEGARRCLALSAASELGLHIGVHAGDVIREENNVFGGAVNIASRICGLSAPGEILVSDVVRGMARSSAGVVFEDRGEQEMKGVGEPVRVYAVRGGE